MTVAIAVSEVTVSVIVILVTEATERIEFDAVEVELSEIMPVTKLVTVTGFDTVLLAMDPVDDVEPTTAVTVTVTGVHPEAVNASTDIKEFCCTPA